MLSPTATTLRLFLHIVAATIWVGGQFALAGVVGPLRKAAPESPKVAANAFARLAWPAYGVLVVTGMWNLMEVDITNTSNAYQATVLLKIAVAIGAGVFVAIHSIGKSKLALALGGALGALCSVGAVYLGVLLQTDWA